MTGKSANGLAAHAYARKYLELDTGQAGDLFAPADIAGLPGTYRQPMHAKAADAAKVLRLVADRVSIPKAWERVMREQRA